MSKLRVLPYKPGSKSAREVVNSLAPNAIMKKQSTPVYGRTKVLLNWGHSSPRFSTHGVTVLNKPQAVAIASDKLKALQVMKAAGVSVPDFTTDISVARQWIEDERMVLCRKLLRSNSGKGIVVAKEVDELVSSPLYVKYVRKEKEYRLHVFNGQVIDLVEKRKRSGYEDNPAFNKYIRSYEQGWIMARENVSVSDATKAECIKAVAALGLDFGAVDVVIRKSDNVPVVLEVNTAPGITGTTVQSYKRAIQSWFNSITPVRRGF